MDLFTKRNKIFLSLFLIAGLLFGLEKVGLIPFLSGITHQLLMPVQVGLYKTGRDISEFAGTVGEIRGLREKSNKLEMENDLLIAENAKLKLLGEENKALREQLDVKLPPKQKIVVASIIGKDPLFSASKILIDRGTSDNVEKNNFVVIKDVLLGQITFVQSSSSTLSLLTDSETKIPATTQGKAKGILKGEFGNSLKLINVVQNQVLENGQLVFTSGEGGYPRGLVLGRISQVNKDPAALFQEAEIEPIINYDLLETVFVISQSGK